MDLVRSNHRSAWVVLLSMTLAGPVFAGHPSVETWTTTALSSSNTTDCLEVTELGGPQSLVSVENQCAQTFFLESAVCSPVDCMLQGEVQATPESTRQISSFDIGLFGGELDVGDTVDVELRWTLRATESGTIQLTLTYDGYTGGEHNEDGQIGNGGDGGKSDPGCGGCTSAQGSGSSLVGLLMLGLVMRRRRGTRT